MTSENAPTGNDDPTGMSETLKKAFDFSQDSTKQLIALSTGVLALTITFFKDFAGGGSPTSKTLIAVAWLFYLVTIVAGALHLYALTAELDPSEEATTNPTIYSGTPRVTAGIQQIAFIVALVITAIAGAVALASGHSSAPSQSGTPATVQRSIESLRARLATAEAEISMLRADNTMLQQLLLRLGERDHDWRCPR